MKYIFFNDLTEIFIKKRMLILLWMIMLIIYPLFIKIILNYDFRVDNISNMLLYNLGGNDTINSVIEYLMMMLSIGIYSYLSISVYLKDTSYGKENIFLRISKRKWVISKLLIIAIYTFILEVIITIILSVVYLLLGANLAMIEVVKIMSIDMLTKIIIQIIGIIFLLLSKKLAFPLIIIIFTVPFAIPTLYMMYPFSFIKYLFSLTYMYHINIALVILAFIITILVLVNNLLLDKIFERSEN